MVIPVNSGAIVRLATPLPVLRKKCFHPSRKHRCDGISSSLPSSVTVWRPSRNQLPRRDGLNDTRLRQARRRQKKAVKCHPLCSRAEAITTVIDTVSGPS